MSVEVNTIYRCAYCSYDYESKGEANRCCKTELDWESGYSEVIYQCEECGEEFDSRAIAKKCKCK